MGLDGLGSVGGQALVSGGGWVGIYMLMCAFETRRVGENVAYIKLNYIISDI